MTITDQVLSVIDDARRRLAEIAARQIGDNRGHRGLTVAMVEVAELRRRITKRKAR